MSRPASLALVNARLEIQQLKEQVRRWQEVARKAEAHRDRARDQRDAILSIITERNYAQSS